MWLSRMNRQIVTETMEETLMTLFGKYVDSFCFLVTMTFTHKFPFERACASPASSVALACACAATSADPRSDLQYAEEVGDIIINLTAACAYMMNF